MEIIEQKVPNLNEINGQSEPFNGGQNQEKFGVAEAVQIAGIVIPAVLSFISNRNNNRANKEIHESDNAFNAAQSLAAFNRNAAYNSPTAERARLAEAGINPALYYQNGSASVNQTPASSSSPIPMQAFNMNPVDFAQMNLMNAQARNLNADTDNKPLEGERIKAEIEHYAAQDENLRGQIQRWRKENEFTDSQILLACAQYDECMQHIDNMIAEEDETRKRIDVMIEEIKVKQAESRYIGEMATYYRNENSLFESYSAWQKKQWDVDNAQADIDLRYLTDYAEKILLDMKKIIDSDLADHEKKEALDKLVVARLNVISKNGIGGRDGVPISDLIALNYLLQMTSGSYHTNLSGAAFGAGSVMRGASALRSKRSTVRHVYSYARD